jgi:dienelactone hydrolase
MRLPITCLLLVVLSPPAGAEDLPAALRRLAATWKPEDHIRQESAELAKRIRAANDRESKAWRGLKGKTDWEKYRDARLEALRLSLGRFPAPPADLHVRVRKTIAGDGFRIDNLTFESQPGLVVTANLYRPAKPGASIPGIVIVHSHHAAKTQNELQDMGAMWSKAGCFVLVMDQPGHGERRQHPFRTKGDYPKAFAVSRQDYHFRYNLAIQLQTIGDSLMGWMVQDIRRGVDLLLAQPGIDAKKIILLGAVAGGGDPAAVAAALDRRITAVAPFNFGGAQPETRFPLPEDAEDSFNYAGGGSWESTRNLAFSARDGFLPWLIVGAAAPRRHLYGHEFAWDEKRDPVWKRLRQIHAWYGHPEHLASTHGSGSVRGRPPESTHCTNIGSVHRKGIYDALKRWFDIAPPVEKSDRRPSEELLCLKVEERLRPLHELAGEIGTARLESARKRLAAMSRKERRARLAAEWQKLLGNVEAEKFTVGKPVAVELPGQQPRTNEGNLTVTAELRGLEVDGAVRVNLLLLRPRGKDKGRLPVVAAFAQGSRRTFLARRSDEIAALLNNGKGVALVEFSGLGSVGPGSSRGRRSSATSLASTALMLGDPRLAARLRELRGVLRFLRTLSDLDARRISLWGDSFAEMNAAGKRVEAPLELPQPEQAEPLGPMLALLGGLFEPDIESIRARGGLIGYRSLLDSPFCHIPYDVIVPGALTGGDLADVVAALAPLPVRLERLVDGRNRLAPLDGEPGSVERAYEVARKAYRDQDASEKLRIEE